MSLRLTVCMRGTIAGCWAAGKGRKLPDLKAIASIARITGGNFRLLHRLFVHIVRLLKINEVTVITDDVVSARCSLVIGAT
jgi:hypothetical protein